MLNLLISSFEICCICSILDYIIDIFSSSIQVLKNLSFDRTILVLFTTVLAGFISITIPVALSIVSKHTEEYKDKEISESFLKEPTYRIQVYLVPILVSFALIVFGLKVESGWLVYFILFLDIAAFIIFVWFLHIFGQYATNFDTYFSNKLKKESDEIVQKND